MLIRAYDDADRAAVIALWRDVFAYTAPHNEPATVIDRKMAVQPELFLVAVEANRVVGTVMGGYDGHRGWVYSLAVHPHSRRRGFATALVRHVERALEALGCLKVNLQVLSANADVIAFYEKLGYRVEDRISMGRLL